MVDAQRTEAQERFRDENGCGRRDAALAARALYPFDDAAEAGQAFAREGAGVAHRFGVDARNLRGNEVGVAAERAIEELLDLARDHREMYYVELLEDVLEQAGGPVAAPEAGE